MNRQDDLIDAAVLLPVYRGESGQLRLILVRRGAGGVHGGQLAFPGGKREAGDRSLLETALRETWEEIGLDPDSVSILEELPVVETVSTGFRITPFLGRIDPPGEWVCRAGEVEEVYDISLTELADPDRRGEECVRLPGWPRATVVPFIRIGRHKLWGATYRMLFPLIPRLLGREWDI